VNELHLFAGAGGGILGGQLLGHRCVCAVEREPYAQAVLVARQNDGTFPPFPIWDDVCTFDGTPWNGVVDVVCGGFPCQDISVAGSGAGLDGERSGLWSEMARIIGEVRPRYAFIENSPALVTRGLDRVLCDLAAMGFDARWGVVSAADVGASHRRERIWILAHSDSLREPQQERRISNERGWPSDSSEDVAYSNSNSIQGLVAKSQPGRHGRPSGLQRGTGEFPAWPADPANAPKPGLGRVADGVAHRANRIKAIGNGQVSRVAAAAFAMLYGN